MSLGNAKRRALLFADIVAFASTALAAHKTLLVNDYGAKGDGTTLGTAANKKATGTAAPKGDTASFKPGANLTGALFLKSGVTVEIPEGVTRATSGTFAADLIVIDGPIQISSRRSAIQTSTVAISQE